MDRAPAPLDRVIDAMFAVALFCVSLLVVFGHRGVAPCVGFMALGVALRPSVWRNGFALLKPTRIFTEPLSAAALATVLFCAWVGVSGLWSPTPGAPWLAVTVLAGALCGGALVREALTASAKRAARFSWMYLAAVVVAVSVLMFEGLSGGYLRSIVPPVDASPLRFKDMTALGRGVTAVAPLVFPAIILLRQTTGSWVIAVAPAAMALLAAAQFSVFANVVAIVAGSFAFVAALAMPRATVGGLSLLFIVALLVAPFAFASMPIDAIIDGGVSAPPSWAQRLIVWKEAGGEALGGCFPLGCGADYARAWSENAGSVALPNWPIPVSVMPTHPHNVFIQIWLELGVFGVAALAVAFAASALGLLRLSFDRTAIAAVAGVLAATFISVMFEASLWQAWRLGVFALAAFGIAVSYSINKAKQLESAF